MTQSDTPKRPKRTPSGLTRYLASLPPGEPTEADRKRALGGYERALEAREKAFQVLLTADAELDAATREMLRCFGRSSVRLGERVYVPDSRKSRLFYRLETPRSYAPRPANQGA